MLRPHGVATAVPSLRYVVSERYVLGREPLDLGVACSARVLAHASTATASTARAARRAAVRRLDACVRRVRVIPCLDVDAGRVVKGVNFVDLRDAGDPVELARAYDAAGRRRAGVPRHHREQRRPRDDVRRGPAYGGAGLHPAHRRRRRARPSTTSTGCCAPAPTRSGVNTAAIARPELLREAAERFGAQCVVLSIDARRCPEGVATDSGWEVTTHGGRRSTGIDAVGWAVPRRRARRGRDPAQLDGRRRHEGRLRPRRCIRAVRAEVTVPVIASGGAGKARRLRPRGRGGGRCRARRERLPLRRPHDRRGQARARRRRSPRRRYAGPSVLTRELSAGTSRNAVDVRADPADLETTRHAAVAASTISPDRSGERHGALALPGACRRPGRGSVRRGDDDADGGAAQQERRQRARPAPTGSRRRQRRARAAPTARWRGARPRGARSTRRCWPAASTAAIAIG